MHSWKLFMALSLAAGLMSCNPDADQPGENEPGEEAAEEQADQAQEAFSRTAKSRIAAMEEQASQLEQQLEKAPENMREELKAELEDWGKRADDLESRIDNFHASTKDQWKEFEGRVNSELDELDRSYKELAQRAGAPATH